MEKSLLDLEKPMKPSFIEIPQKVKSISLSAFLFSFFIYLFLSHPSPATLLKDTGFWFFLSNVIILVIAADSGAFSSKQKYDLYEEYLRNSRVRRVSSFVAQPPENVPKAHIEKKPEIYSERKILPVSMPEASPKAEIQGIPKEETPEELETSKEETPESEAVEEKTPESHTKVDVDAETRFETKDIKPMHYRSKSEKSISDEMGNENTKNLLRSESEKHETRSEEELEVPKEEENEFSTMSDEELNRRVEEFIQRINRQMRLQESSSLRGWELDNEI
ncbi:PREDICTED: uncharacterized protein LOC104588756 [Nelumbo nucifera]|uniref:Uncharacterized protein n=2 Tax=Nelumbo nucifera TaxID=4432 RepID=A0A822YYQ4_NELNU|nr:PREDICTED: uncharacterized protein LOC104588756 [Nelumbo nucifera]DAD37353.1 TPA_asm: hypothetical protein HUJ06_007994 [Nelumbo nucifera]